MASCPPPLHQIGTDDGGNKEFHIGRVRFGIPFQHLTGDTHLGDSKERVLSEAQVAHRKSKKSAAQSESTDRAEGGWTVWRREASGH